MWKITNTKEIDGLIWEFAICTLPSKSAWRKVSATDKQSKKLVSNVAYKSPQKAMQHYNNCVMG